MVPSCTIVVDHSVRIVRLICAARVAVKIVLLAKRIGLMFACFLEKGIESLKFRLSVSLVYGN
jgi:coenzyme F420-reducing hydrogenase delta subunit